jgi:hypothetical protein
MIQVTYWYIHKRLPNWTATKTTIVPEKASITTALIIGATISLARATVGCNKNERKKYLRLDLRVFEIIMIG